MTDDEQQKLTVMLVELSGKIQTMLDKQEELAENVSKIKEAVYNPDSGLVREIKRIGYPYYTIREPGKPLTQELCGWLGVLL